MAYRVTTTPLINHLLSHHHDYLHQYNHNLTNITHYTLYRRSMYDLYLYSHFYLHGYNSRY